MKEQGPSIPVSGTWGLGILSGRSVDLPIETELYELLGLSVDASEDDIKKAYRRKAKEHHPDKNPNDPDAGQKFQEIAAAYEILSETRTRAIYDSHGMAGLSGRGGRGGMDAADIFADLFGDGMGFSFSFGQGPGSRQTKGRNTSIPYDVTLEDLYNGKNVKMNLEKEVLCSACKGSGARGSAKPKPCATCEGKGWTYITNQIAPSRLGTSRAVCSNCDGKGVKLREKDRCKKCKGSKTVKEKTRQEIFIEKGMANSQRIVLAEAGDQEPGLPTGDVVFVLKATPHPVFERSGNDLLTNVTITLSEALLGFDRILITHLDGRGVHISTPPGKIIKSGASIILRGEGMPVYKQPDQKGNLYVIFDIEMPDEAWMRSIETKALEAVLPPKKRDIEPRPEAVDQAIFEESDIVDFGSNDDWEDDDDDDDDDEYGEAGMGEPECVPQ